MDGASAWDGNWAWGVPLIAITVVFHVIGLGLFNVKADLVLTDMRKRRNYEFIFVFFMAVTTIWTTFLLAVSAGVWAVAFRSLGALLDNKSAMLYSLSAITTYGHTDLYLAPQGRLLGALEALDGIMLFGLTTAFMYGMIQRVWPIDRRHGHAQ